MPAKIPKPTILANVGLPKNGIFRLGEKLIEINGKHLDAQKTQIQAPVPQKQSNNVQKHLKDYLLAVAKTGCSSSTVRNYRSDINQFLDFADSKDLNDLRNKPKLLAFAHYQREKGLKENSVKRKLVSITQFKIWLKQQGLINSEIPLIPVESVEQEGATNTDNDTSARKIIGQGSETPPKETPVEKVVLDKKEPKKPKKPQSRLFILLNVLALLLFLGGLAYFAYQQFGQAIISLAYPSTPTAPNRILSYQGRLTNTDQTPISDPTAMTYALYDADTGGSVLWSSNTCTLDPDQDGIFNANLGAGAGAGSDTENCGGNIGEDVFTENNNVWLEVTIGAETLLPRQPIRTVAYALNAATLQGLPPAEVATNSTILMMNSNGELVLGMENPLIKTADDSSGLTIESKQITIQTTTDSNGNIILAPDGDGKVDIQSNLDVSGDVNLTSPNTLIFGGTTALGEISSPTDSGAYLIGVNDQFANSNSTNVQGVLADLDSAIGTAGNPAWSNLIDSEADLALNHGTFTTDFNWDTGTGTDNLFSLTTDASSNGTGSLLNLQTGTSSTVSLLRVRSGSTEALFIDNAGNVGIGNTSPSEKLDVTGNVRFSGALMPNNTAGTSGQFLISGGAGAAPTWTSTIPATSVPFSGITSGTNTTSAMVVGAGASLDYTSTGTINASSLLGGTWATPGSIGSTTPNTGAFTTLGSTGDTTLGDASTDTVTANAATWTFANDTNFALTGGVNGLSFDTNTLSIDATNNRVGIGLTNPASTLSVLGNIDAGFGTDTTRVIGIGLDGSFSSGDTGIFRFADANNQLETTYGGTMKGKSYHGWQFYDNAGEIARFGLSSTSLNSYLNGSVRIGSTVAPTQALDVTGNVRFSGALMPNNAAGTSGQFLISGGAGAAPTWTSTIGASTVPFSGITSGTNTTAAMVVGAGASLNYTSTGTINASSLLGGTWAAPGSIGSTTPNTGAFTTLGSTGNATFGDAAGDLVTANAATWTFANDTNFTLTGGTNGLSFDTNTLSIDATNDRVGIGTTTPAHKLDVNGNIGLAVSGYINWGNTDGSTGYGIRDNAGAIEFKNSAGEWAKLGTGDSLWINNGTNINPANLTQDVFVGGDSTASAKIALKSTGDSYFDGNMGIGIDPTLMSDEFALTETSEVLPNPVAYQSCAEDSSTNKIYCLGGINNLGEESSSIVEYDPATDTATTMTETLPAAIIGLSCAENSSTHEIYCFGGLVNDSASSLIIKYNPNTHAVTTMTETIPLFFLSSCVENSSTHKIYCLGGASTETQIVEYNPATDTATIMTETLSAEVVGSSCAEDSSTNKIYCVGATATDTQIVEYNPATDTATNMTAAFSGIVMATGCAENSSTHKIYCFGGIEGMSNIISTIVEYDPTTNTATTLTDSLSSARFLNACSEDSSTNKIYCFGGTGFNELYEEILIDQITEFSDIPSGYNSLEVAGTVQLRGSLSDTGLFVDSNGNVGIGTTSVKHTLDVAGNIGISANGYLNWGNVNGGSGYGLRDNAGVIEFKNSAGEWAGLGSGGGDSLWTNNGETVSLANLTQDVLIGGDSTASAAIALKADGDAFFNGNVGVGTSTPGGKLDIAGGFLVLDNGDLGSSRGIRFREAADTITPNGGAIYQANNDNLYIQAGSANYINLRDYSGTNQFSFDTSTAVLGFGTAGGGLKPSSGDSTTAIQIKDYNNNAFVNFDSTNQRVGIGTVSPSSKLHVVAMSGEGNPTYDGGNSLILQGNSVASNWNRATIIAGTTGSSVLEFGDKDDANAGFIRYDHSTNKLSFATNSIGPTNSSMVIDSAGNVGIGVTDPTSILQIGGASSTIVNDAGDITIDSASNNISLAGDNLINVGNGLFAGNLGIGTNVPIFQTEIFGNGQLTANLTDAGNRTGMLAINGNSTSAGAGGAIVFGNSSSHTANSLGFAAIKGLLTDSTANTIGALAFSTRATTAATSLTERMRITAGGFVGIGTDNPNEMLMVNGSINAEKYYDLTNKNYYLDPASVGTSLKIAGNAEIEGNVGLGTASSTYKLSIGGATSTIANTTGDITINAASNNISLAGDNLINVGDGTFVNGYFSNSVGIGTTSPVGKLNVVSANTANPSLTADTNQITNFQVGNVQLASGIITASPWTYWFQTKNSGNTGASYPLALNPLGGNVGIGTTAPQSKLSVSGGNISLGVFNTQGASTAKYIGVAGISDTWGGASGSTNIGFFTDADNASGHLEFATHYSGVSSGTRMLIDKAGKVGIGTTTPQAGLHLDSDAVNNIIIRSTASNASANTTLETLGIYRISMGVSATALYQYYTDSSNVARYIATTGTAIDLAEWYKVGSASLDSSGNSKLKKGQLLCIDNSATEKVVACSAENNQLIGIVSTQSYQTMGMNDLDDDHHDATEVALAGRVPLITTIKNGQQIKSGDHLAASNLTGVSSKATKAGDTVAKALDNTNWSTQSCPAVSSLDAISWPSDDGTNKQKPCFTLPDGSIVGKIMAFVNVSWYDPSAYLRIADLSLDTNGDVIITGNSEETYAIATSTSVVDRVAAFANVFTARLQAGFIKTKELVADALIATNATITNLTAPNLETDTITSSDGQIDIISNATISGSLAVTGDLDIVGDTNINDNLTVTGESKLGQLIANDASISGTLTTGHIETDELEANSARINAIETQLAQIENATVSGTLYAENIEANSISANVISGLKERLSEQIAETLTQPTLLATLFAQQTAQTDEYLGQLSQEINGDATASATTSTTLADLDANISDSTLIADNAFINEYFEVNGNAFIANSLKIGQSLLVGENTVYGTDYISYQPVDTTDFTFHIQPAGMGKISLMAGLMELDQQGFVTINGDLKVAGVLEVEDDLKVKGTLLTNMISAETPGENIQIQLASIQEGTDSATIAKSNFEFVDETRTPVATVSAGGDLSLTGSLRINNPTTASESSAIANSSSAGQATLEAGATEITIASDKVEENSMIYVTPLNSTNNQVLYVKNKTTNSSFTSENDGQFTVAIDYALGHNVVFNWWIIQLN